MKSLEESLEKKVERCVNSPDHHEYYWLYRADDIQCRYHGQEVNIPVMKGGMQGHKLTYSCDKSRIDSAGNN